MTVPHRLLALAGGLLLGLTGCTSFSESADPSATPSATSAAPTQEQVELIAWRDCNAQIQPLIAGQPGADRGLSFECGRTDVSVIWASQSVQLTGAASGSAAVVAAADDSGASVDSEEVQPVTARSSPMEAATRPRRERMITRV